LKKTIIIALALLLTVIILRELLRLLPSNFSTSVFPGIHFTIHSNEWILTVTSVIILIVVLLITGVFKILKNILIKFWV